jgi:hypothetical protein
MAVLRIAGITVLLVAACITNVCAFSQSTLLMLRGSGSQVCAGVGLKRKGALRQRGGVLLCKGSVSKNEVAQELGICDGAACRYWEGMNSRNIDFALEQFSDDIFFQDMMFPEPITSKEDLRAHFQKYD